MWTQSEIILPFGDTRCLSAPSGTVLHREPHSVHPCSQPCLRVSSTPDPAKRFCNSSYGCASSTYLPDLHRTKPVHHEPFADCNGTPWEPLLGYIFFWFVPPTGTQVTRVTIPVLNLNDSIQMSRVGSAIRRYWGHSNWNSFSKSWNRPTCRAYAQAGNARHTGAICNSYLQPRAWNHW